MAACQTVAKGSIALGSTLEPVNPVQIDVCCVGSGIAKPTPPKVDAAIASLVPPWCEPGQAVDFFLTIIMLFFPPVLKSKISFLQALHLTPAQRTAFPKASI